MNSTSIGGGQVASHKACSWRLSYWWKRTEWLLLLLLTTPVFESLVPIRHYDGLPFPSDIWPYLDKENKIHVPDTCQLAIVIACIYIMSFCKDLKAPFLWKSISDLEGGDKFISIFTESYILVTILYSKLCCILNSAGDLQQLWLRGSYVKAFPPNCSWMMSWASGVLKDPHMIGMCIKS
jgi:hypothetical protein